MPGRGGHHPLTCTSTTDLIGQARRKDRLADHRPTHTDRTDIDAGRSRNPPDSAE